MTTQHIASVEPTTAKPTIVANPDLPERLEENATLNTYNRSTFYGGTEKGYIDYPALKERR